MGGNKCIKQDEPYEFICKHYRISSVSELKQLLDNTYGVPVMPDEPEMRVKQPIILLFQPILLDTASPSNFPKIYYQVI